jgi:hypothetical protein
MSILSMTGNEATDTRQTLAPPPDTAATRSCGPVFWALIDRSDEALLDFGTEATEFDLDRARALLAQHPTTYRNHLTIAKFLEGWVARITSGDKATRFNQGFVEALLEMVDHLRDGDFATEEGDGVGYDGPSRTARLLSTNGDRRTSRPVHARRRTVLVPTDLSHRGTVIGARRS